MAGIKISPNRLAISISVNGLNAYWMTDTLQLGLKNKSLMYAACKIHLQKNDRRRLKKKEDGNSYAMQISTKSK